MGRYVVRLRRTRALQSRFSRFIYRFIFEPGNFRYHLSSPSSLYPLPSLSLSLSGFSLSRRLDIYHGSKEEMEGEGGGGGKKVAVFKERYFAKSVETAVEEEEEEDGDRVSLKPDEATAIEKLADPPYRFSSLGVGRRGKDVSRCPYQRNSALNDIGRAAVNLGTGNPLPSPPRSDEREPI